MQGVAASLMGANLGFAKRLGCWMFQRSGSLPSSSRLKKSEFKWPPNVSVLLNDDLGRFLVSASRLKWSRRSRRRLSVAISP